MTTLATLPSTREQDELLTLYTNPDTCPTDALEPRPLVEEPAFISWQQDIPREYLELSPEELDRRIRYARAVLGKRLVVLGHHYQRDEVIQYADFTGDSFELAQHAAEQTEAEFVVFCGVHFMAESADILTPPRVARDAAEHGRRLLDGRHGRPRRRLRRLGRHHGGAGRRGQGHPGHVHEQHGHAEGVRGRTRRLGLHFEQRGEGVPLRVRARRQSAVLPDQHLGRNTGWELGHPAR